MARSRTSRSTKKRCSTKIRRPLPENRRPHPKTRSHDGDLVSTTDNRLPPLLLLHPDDNIVVARRDIAAGESVELDGEAFVIPARVELGHKLARRAIAANARVLKYGAPIGSMKVGVNRGE